MLRAAKSVTPWAGHCTEVPVPWYFYYHFLLYHGHDHESKSRHITSCLDLALHCRCLVATHSSGSALTHSFLRGITQATSTGNTLFVNQAKTRRVLRLKPLRLGVPVPVAVASGTASGGYVAAAAAPTLARPVTVAAPTRSPGAIGPGTTVTGITTPSRMTTFLCYSA